MGSRAAIVNCKITAADDPDHMIAVLGNTVAVQAKCDFRRYLPSTGKRNITCQVISARACRQAVVALPRLVGGVTMFVVTVRPRRQTHPRNKSDEHSQSEKGSQYFPP